MDDLPPLDRIQPEHVAYVRSVLGRLRVTPAHVREDLAQEALIEAHRSRGSPLDVRALLFGITRHVVLRWLAKRRAERIAVDVAQVSPSVEDAWEEAERREAVHAAIDELPDIFREVFVRSEVEHMSMPEIADDLGIPLNTGYTRLSLARERFIEALRRHMARKGEL